MPSITSVLTCRVDGLLKVYICDESAYFEFKNAIKLKTAKEKVIQFWNRNDPLKFTTLFPKKAIFCFGVPIQLITAEPSIGSTQELIKRIAHITASKISDKNVPIEQIKSYELI
ncbi:MAG: hypothetical protein ACRCU0_07560 [Candidatus Rhabdochlamydia sp.]